MSPDATRDPQSTTAEAPAQRGTSGDSTPNIEADVPSQVDAAQQSTVVYLQRESSVTPVSGQLIGDYEIVGEIARGGMGVVYKARQRGVNRVVALKMTLAGQFAGDDERQRFLAEAEAAGQLDHPNIVPIFEVGENDGQPFFSMGYVDGPSLKALIANGPLPAQQAAELTRTIALAVEYAHTRGIIHRDLKPTNVLIDANGQPRVTDFGLAKRVETESGLTATGQILGTPSFMPPEQAQGQIDQIGPASDVYSLGAMLYNMLAGRPPFQAATIVDTLIQVIEQDPIPPRRLNPSVSLDLDTICQKCLQKEPTRRYRTAADLAADIGRFLRGEPIRARPIGLAERTWRWYRRNRLVGNLATAAVALLIAVAFGGIGWVRVQQRESLRVARVSAHLDQAVAGATRLLQDARSARDSAQYADAIGIAQRAEELFSGIGEGSDRPDVRQLRTEISSDLRALRRDKEMVDKLAEIRIRRSELYVGGFDFVTAGPSYAAAFRDYNVDVERLEPSALADAISKSAIRRELVAALDEWAWIRSRTELASQWQPLIAAAASADPDPWRNKLRDAVTRRDLNALKSLGAEADVAQLPPATLELLGHNLGLGGARSEAIALLRRAQAQYPDDFWINHYLAHFLDTDHPRQWGDAIRFYSVAVALRKQSPGVYVNLGQAFLHAQLFDQAVQSFETAIARQPDYVMAHVGLADALHRNGDDDRARDVLERATSLTSVKHSQSALGSAFLKLGSYEKAREALERAVLADPNDSDARTQLGIVFMQLGTFEQAIRVFSEVCDRNPENATVHAYLGAALSNHGELDRAIVALRRAVSLDSETAAAHKWLGTTLSKKKQNGEAIEAFNTAIRLKPDDADAHQGLALALKAEARWDDAVSSLREAIRLKPDRAESHFELAIVLSDQKEGHTEAVSAFREAIRLKPEYPEAWCNLGHVFEVLGRYPEALEATRRGHEIGAARSDWKYPSAEWVKKLERLADMDRRVALIQRGEAKASDAGERMRLAKFCFAKGDFAGAAQFCSEAFDEKHELADDLKANNRYNAACAAVLAATKPGPNGLMLGDTQQARWRNQAREWLVSDLVLMTEMLERGAIDRSVVDLYLREWRQDRKLTAVRDDALLSELPAAEQPGWRKLWMDVESLARNAAHAD